MFLTFDKQGILNNGLRDILGGIDYIVYSIISWILEGIFNLSKLTTNGSFAATIYKRIYIILSIFMVFKLTISFIQYLVNPDSFMDKEKGIGKLISRTVLMLALLIFVPIILFEPMPGKSEDTILNVLQRGVINTIPKIILGVSDNSERVTNSNETDAIAEKAKSMGVGMSLRMLETFYYPRDCGDGDDETTGEAACVSELTDLKSLTDTIVDKGNNGYYKYRYMWPLSTICGIMLVVILIGFAIDVAMRVFKLIVLQMVAPIPIMSYIDPKSSKDGAFASWLKAFTSTYIDVFLKLTVIYLLLLLFQQLFQGGILSGGNILGNSMDNTYGTSAKSFVKIFLVIGLFKFAKDAPKFIKEALGLKDKGGGGGAMGGMLAGLAGGAAGFAAGVAGGGGLAGGMSGLTSGFSMGKQNAGSGKPLNAFSKIRDEQAKALNKPQGGLKGKMQIAANKKALAKMGVSDKTLDEAKATMLNDKQVAEDRQRELDELLKNRDATGASSYTDSNGNVTNVSAADYGFAVNALRTARDAASTQSAKSEKRYNQMDKAYEAGGAKKGFYQKHHEGIVDKLGNAYSAIRHPIATAEENISSIPGRISNVVQDTFSVRGNDGKRFTERGNNARAERYNSQNQSGRTRNRDQV